LLQAAKENTFSVSVSDEWYPAMGFYVTSIAGHNAEGLEGWNFRVDNHTTGFHSSDSFVWQSSNPPSTPHNEVTWFYGSWDANALKITADSTDVNVGEDINVLVEYYHEVDNVWYPAEGATIKGASSEETTNTEGKAAINFSSEGTKQVYAEKPSAKYYRSRKLFFEVEAMDANKDVTVNDTPPIMPVTGSPGVPAAGGGGGAGPSFDVNVSGNCVNKELIVTVLNASGNPAKDATVSVLKGRATLQEKTTKEDGIVSFTFSEVGEYTFVTKKNLYNASYNRVTLIDCGKGAALTDLCVGISCDDSNPCTIDNCDSNTGKCNYSTAQNGTSCGENKECLNGICTAIERREEGSPLPSAESSLPQTPTGFVTLGDDKATVLLLGCVSIAAVIGAQIYLTKKKLRARKK
jgi:hypothetical protein